MKKITLIIVTFFTLIIVCILLYLYGFIYSFRDFAGTGDYWKPLQEYEILGYKETVDQNINEVVVKNSSMLNLSRDKNEFSKEIFTLNIIHLEDTTEFAFRFRGDSSSWINETKSTILLLSIADKHFDISSTNIDKTDKTYIRRKIDLFEKSFITILKSNFK